MSGAAVFTRRWKSLAESEQEAAKTKRGRFDGSVCWSWLRRRDGTCYCTDNKGKGTVTHLVHLGGNGQSYPCAQHLNEILGSGRACKEDSERCSGDHWSFERLQEALGAENRSRGPGAAATEDGLDLAKPAPKLQESQAVLSHGQTEKLGTRSVESAAGDGVGGTGSAMDPARLAKIIHREAEKHENKYLAEFETEAWYSAFLDDARLAALLHARHRSKEITEAYGVAARVQVLLTELSLPHDGDGLVLLDMCSGKGFTGVLLSLKFPKAKVVLVDANGQMNLSHCTARPNLSFRHLDLFSSQVRGALMQEIGHDKAAVAVGMHLCGALSPRLIDVFAGIPALQGLILCPCCLKGSLGKGVKVAAKLQGRPYDEVLTETLVGVAERMLAEAGLQGCHVREEVDAWMLSPKRRFVVGHKAHAAATRSPEPVHPAC